MILFFQGVPEWHRLVLVPLPFPITTLVPAATMTSTMPGRWETLTWTGTEKNPLRGTTRVSPLMALPPYGPATTCSVMATKVLTGTSNKVLYLTFLNRSTTFLDSSTNEPINGH